jgi:L,D-peptidoglycan transpeptidase YkuD (ErfK/YbiS/YcfS/YnhG family)
MRGNSWSRLMVRHRAGDRKAGWLSAGPLTLPVALGRAGIKANKREGDGATPRGTFHPLRLWWRADKHARPPTLLPVRPIGANDAWCEAPGDRHYNQPVKLAPGSGGDRLRRADDLYDFIVELDHNTRPRVKGRGSAVFIHVGRPGLAPTAGCIALQRGALRRLLAHLTPRTKIVVD